MSTPIFQVDSFTNEPFRGNPAGVCLLTDPQPDDWMASVAREMNLSETAFLLPEGSGYRLRWFTPAAEVDLCGHATLASAHILWETGRLQPEQEARFETRSGTLTAARHGDWIQMNFPVTAPTEVTTPAGLLEALFSGSKPTIARYVGKSIFDYLVEIDGEDAVRNLKPDFVELNKYEARGIIVTSRASGKYDFISRFFGPQVGINEDPVTGSSHSCLTPYWAKKLNKTDMMAYQASARGGELHVILSGDRVLIEGQAVTTIKGELL